MERKALLLIAILTVGVLSAGCRSKALESYQSATTVNEDMPNNGGDPGSRGGIADASGGRNPQTSYATNVKGKAGVQSSVLTK